MPFKRDLASYRKAFERDGYVLLKDVLSDRFMAHLYQPSDEVTRL